ncbi:MULTISPECIES: hypothetical protein [unclassified Novosphingobium]|uniref:hypothetical protein n=1 Tax=unclassified Novosphingobium TaxID=2644732 RepID=UPI00146D612F|nr:MULTISPECIES: hypothetical protein [unclassified Novosphingobium]NMN07005.1 Meckel syndrome type 1 protein [Novosphingobium sp. SG919]NMN89407.1 Meckel syndrome type 1 protein [Novosphingobium sp. SG916]
MACLSNRFTTLQRLCMFGAIAAPALLLGACSPDRGRFPSLAIRPAERAFGQAQAAPANPAPANPAPLPTDASLPQRLAAIEGRAREADSRFAALVPEATRAVARAQGTASGGETWNLAQVALARLESARSETAIALADLDQMATKAEITAVDQPGPDAETIVAARDAVAARVAQQDAVLARIKG